MQPSLFYPVRSDEVEKILARHGRIFAPGYVRAAEGIVGFQCDRQLGHLDATQEAILEAVRGELSTTLPSRRNSLSIYLSRADAEWSVHEHLSGCGEVHEVRIVHTLSTGRFDQSQLDRPRCDWMIAAYDYWLREESPKPRIEMLVNGVIQFRD